MAEVEPRLVVKILRVADAHIRIAFAADPVHDLQCVKLKIIVRVPEDHIFSRGHGEPVVSGGSQ